MSRIVAVEYLSIDGVMESPSWSGPYFNDEVAQFQYDNLFEADALLLGRVTYEGFKTAWPSMSDPQGFADRMNGLPKFVATSTLTEPEWNATFLTGNLTEAVGGVKFQSEGSLLVNGSADLFRFLHAEGLIDEYRFMIYPVVVGAGKKLFSPEATAADLTLTKSVITTSGVAILTYVRSEAAAAE